MKNKNILELCLADGLGGLEMFVASCYKEFAKYTTCKIVVAPKSKLDNYLEVDDKFDLKRNKLFQIVPALKLAKYIDDNDIDIIHFHWTKDIVTAVLAKILSKKKPKLVQSRHMDMTRFKDDFYHKWLYKNIDMIHAVTYQVKAQLEKFIPQTVRPCIEMIYLGTEIPNVDTKQVELLKEKYNLRDEFVVGIVGRIEKQKGQYKVLEAIAKLKELNIKAFIVGSAMENSYIKELQQKAKELEVDDKVVFTGFTKQIPEYMQLFDVNILATENETFGLVIIEAMANKIPVIATNKGGPLEIIEDGFNGLLFDGSIEQLSQKIQQLYMNKDLQYNLKLNAYKTVQEKFLKSIQLKKLFDLLNQNLRNL